MSKAGFVAYSPMIILLCGFIAGAAEKPLYQNDFEQAKLGAPPEELMILGGEFSVKEEAGNKFLELPGAPLDSFSVQFGPAATNAISASATIRATSKGRRRPTFGVGLFGVAGYKLQVSPGKNAIELYRDQSLLRIAGFDWKSGEWVRLKLQATQSEGKWKIAGKIWQKDAPEPSAWLIEADDTPEQAPSGRASLLGSPFAGTPIQYDDLLLTSPL